MQTNNFDAKKLLVFLQLTHVTKHEFPKIGNKVFHPYGSPKLISKDWTACKTHNTPSSPSKHINFFSRKIRRKVPHRKKRKTQNTAFSVRFRKDTPFFTADGERSRTPRHSPMLIQACYDTFADLNPRHRMPGTPQRVWKVKTHSARTITWVAVSWNSAEPGFEL